MSKTNNIFDTNKKLHFEMIKIDDNWTIARDFVQIKFTLMPLINVHAYAFS